MTAYVTDGQGCDLILWADTDDEALMLAAMVGADPIPRFVQWYAFRLTPEQWGEALIQGAQMTDRWEPRRQMAEREGDHAWLQRIDAVRMRGQG
jgi:hypothetical protein